MYMISLVTALFAVIFTFLSLNTIRLRQKYKEGYIPTQPELIRAHRAHANFSEYVPLSLLLLWAVVLCKGPLWLCALIAVILVVGRLCHIYGLLKSEAQDSPSFRWRKCGMMLTFFQFDISEFICFFISV
ncbi:hypothetical protein BGC07_06950 [Piscirickettsia litoralis]|uniref:Glutathione S-transferase n=1 Tax=Piscirickettsia litoralis TaxID=1891921 RepID=A0ABX3A576_9GAMM|nr:hypothetical protein BGC07_06950 [Piscirickettsia litoralis]